MLVHIIWVGKTKDKCLQEGLLEYLKRLSAYMKIEITEILNESKKNISKEEIKNIEGEKILKSDRKSTRLNSSHIPLSRMPSSA